MQVDIAKMLQAKLGESGSKIKVLFRKTIYIRQYESEVVEIEASIDVPNEVSGAERDLMAATLQAQVEYQGYNQLHTKGFVTAEELEARKTSLIQELNYIKAAGEQVTGKSMDKYFV